MDFPLQTIPFRVPPWPWKPLFLAFGVRFGSPVEVDHLSAGALFARRIFGDVELYLSALHEGTAGERIWMCCLDCPRLILRERLRFMGFLSFLSVVDIIHGESDLCFLIFVNQMWIIGPPWKFIGGIRLCEDFVEDPRVIKHCHCNGIPYLGEEPSIYQPAILVPSSCQGCDS